MMRALALLMIAAAGALFLVRRAQAAGSPLPAMPDLPLQWTETIFSTPAETPAAGAGPLSWFLPAPGAIPDMVSGVAPFVEASNVMTENEAQANIAAFLAMIRTAEGTAGPNGYRTMFGGALFDSFADHPRIKNTATFNNGKTVTSTAAGAYQFLERTWDEARRALGLVDFSPASQDAAAVWLIARRGALQDVREGRFDVAVAKCAKEWASLPGSPYGQPTITAQRARELYAGAGGAFA